MIMLSLVVFPLVGLALLAVFVGVYRQREHLDHHIFLKHRPALAWCFWSPVGESDKRLSEISPREQAAEILYREFVEQGNGYRRSFPLFID